MRAGCLATLGVLIIIGLSGSVIAQAIDTLRVDPAIVVRSMGIGIVMGVLFVALPAFAFGWERRANKTRQEAHAGAESKYDKERRAW